MIECISALTLATHDMAQAVRFYQALGFVVHYGGAESPFTSLRAGVSYLNLIAESEQRQWSWWGRPIFYVTDIDAFYDHACAAGILPEMEPRDGPWAERYFHLTDPDGHELSFAMPIKEAAES